MDGRTDRRAIAYTRYSVYAVALKNCSCKLLRVYRTTTQSRAEKKFGRILLRCRRTLPSVWRELKDDMCESHVLSFNSLHTDGMSMTHLFDQISPE